MRPHRCQPAACQAAISTVLGIVVAEQIMLDTGIATLPAELPNGPRDKAQLAAELQPFATLYRQLLHHTERETALAIMRRAIIDSGSVSHANSAANQPLELQAGEPLVLTSPPPPGFHASEQELIAGFNLAMDFFSCEGELLNYTPDLLRFTITDCNWCHAMHSEGTPELIPFFCETDERFMDGHPTHQLVRPTAIGLGNTCCDFQFVRR